MNNRRRWIESSSVLLLTAAVLASSVACASSGSGSAGADADDSPPLPAQTRNVLRVADYAPVEIYNEPGVGVRVVAASARNAWGVLGGVYEQMGIPVTQANPRAMQLGNPGYRARRVEGDRMNTFIDCGSDFSGPLANQYDITLSITTKLTPKDDESTEVLTVMDAYGRPQAVSGNPIHCQSRGVLEMRVAQAVAEALGVG